MVREIPDYEDSGDSLERDDGRDLGEMPKSMMIQVTQSDQEEGEEEEVAEKTARYNSKNYSIWINRFWDVFLNKNYSNICELRVFRVHSL